MSTIKVNTLTTLNGSGNITVSRPFTGLSGSGASLTALNATELTSGTIPIARIADDAITNAKMADDAIGVAQLSATGTASNSVFLRGDNAWAAAGGGKVLQVLNAVKTDTSSINSTTYADISGLSLTITPSATTSKILFIMNVSAGGAADANHIYLNMVRGSTNILVGGTAGNRTSSTNLVNTQGLGQQITATATYLDSPSTTSATTYKIQWKNNGGATNYINMSTRDNNGSTHDGRVTSQITLMEIGA